MYLDKIFCGLFLFEIQISVVYGFNESCDVNTTLIVPLGINATFETNNVRLSKSESIQFSSKSNYIFRTFTDYLKFRVPAIDFHPEMEARTTVDIEEEGTPNIVTFIITLANLSLKDNGTYLLRTDYKRYCWIPFIMDIRLTPSGPITENSAARINGHPLESLIQPYLNATLMWLVDDLTVDQTSEFLIFDDVLWIRNVGRQLHGRNVTYRATQENGQIDEVSITLEVAYGPRPAFPLIFTPEDTHYTLKSGDSLPDISCHADCNPPCEVTWVNHSADNTLRLGHVFASAAGRYSCVAQNSLITVSKSLYVYVVDDCFTRAALFAVGSIQACTTVVLGICGLLYCFSKRGMSCSNCMHQHRENVSKCLQQNQQHADKNIEELKGKEVSAKKGQQDTELDSYEDLHLGRGKLQLYDHAVPEQTKKKKKKLDVYENTFIASLCSSDNVSIIAKH